MNELSYIGQFGYTIPKKHLTKQEYNKIKEELTVIPFSTMSLSKLSFPIFYESSNKMYLPKYYGIKKYGIPTSIKIGSGSDIDVTFNGTLKPIQEIIITEYLQNIYETYGGGLIELQCGGGKTVIGLNIISRLKKKTLIIVHKEFLLNQWLERISQFLPDANVGRIQANTVDIENKDIVIGMLQSISMKNYDKEIFTSFGLLLVDEVHHISSEVFSRALLKIGTKYTLGLSATMERKDKTSHVFKMFLGDIVYKVKNNTHHNVEVRRVDYESENEEFNRDIVDFRGNIAYSSMIVKLCNFKPRIDFIVDLIIRLFKERPSQKLLLLSQNRSLLNEIHDKISSQTIECGKYVGGMKQDNLKESEGKQLILATYSMASEALDIPELDTLMFATPKTDIIQSVGRILRKPHSNPLIVDIVDNHRLFKNQYYKRYQYYKKNNYSINQNIIYTEDEDETEYSTCLI